MAPSEVDQATAFLSEYIGKSLRIHTDDKRIFVGEMKCTDRECNIILALTKEYRPPADDIIKAAVLETGTPSAQVPFSNRYVGLVVVPGKYITKIEFEEPMMGRPRNPNHLS